jgi:hypothetical protein
MSSMPQTLHTAGKITVLTSLVGVVVFTMMFLLNLGAEEFQKAEAQSLATTSVNVLNTPPQWTIDAEEEIGSSTTTPTNSGSEVAWVATATDSNGAPYFLLICDDATPPIPGAATNTNNLGIAPPSCDTGVTQWAVSTGTVSGTEARAATTTMEAWAESNDWYAWVCDDDPDNARCNVVPKQGTGTTSSPFNVNHRPTFTAYSDNSNAASVPGTLITWTSTADDVDTTGTADTVKLFVCSTNSFNLTTSACNGTTIATSSYVATDPSATYTIVIPTRDANYGAYGFVIDNHGHAATGGQQGVDSVLTVGNATPFVNAGDITLNDGDDITLTTPAGQTTGLLLQFAASDNNSCETSTSSDEIVGYDVSVYRTGANSTSTCDAANEYDANDCYTSAVPQATWNLSCTASSTSCTGPTDLTMIYECTFPLWYIADPTLGGATSTPYDGTAWAAAASAIDDDGAQGVLTQGTITQGLYGLLAFALDTIAIPYGSLEPGDRNTTLTSTTTMRATGNVGLDQLLTGESMCRTYTTAVTCPTSATSTIAERYQVFATSSVSYGAASSTGNFLSSTTQKELEVNILKPTATSTQTSKLTYWGIEVPSTITLAGAYTGENTFTAKVSEPLEW